MAIDRLPFLAGIDGGKAWPRDDLLCWLDALTWLPLDRTAWHEAAPLAEALCVAGEEDEQVLAVLARVPLRRVREWLRAQANGPRGEATLGAALALATQHDAEGVPALMQDFLQAPSPRVAQGLAMVLQPQAGLPAQVLSAGVRSQDPSTVFWTAVAQARLAGSGEDDEAFAALDRLWRAAVADGDVPGFDFADPHVGEQQLATARPLPSAARDWLLARARRQPDAVRSSRGLGCLLAGLTGAYDLDGEPRPDGGDDSALQARAAARHASAERDLNPSPAQLKTLLDRLWRGVPLKVPDDDLGTLTRLEPAPAAQLMQACIDRILALASAVSPDDTPTAPTWMLGNAWVGLAQLWPEPLPLNLLPIIDDPRTARMPRRQLAWLLGRVGDEALLAQLGPAVSSATPSRRRERLGWLRDIAMARRGGPPLLGGGAAPVLPPVVTEWADGSAAAPAPRRRGPTPRRARHDSGARRRTVSEALDAMEEADDGVDGDDGEAAPPTKSIEPDAVRVQDERAAADPQARHLGPPPPDKQFYFALRGDQARRDAICAGTDATLVFDHAVPIADALARVSHEGLEKARTSDRKIMLMLAAYGSLELTDACTDVAEFEHGALRRPLEFGLHAGMADAPGGPRSGVHVDFIVGGSVVHQMDLGIRVVRDAAALQRHLSQPGADTTAPADLLADAARATARRQHQLCLTLGLREGALSIMATRWVDGEPTGAPARPFRHPVLDRASLNALIDLLRTDLQPCYTAEVWKTFDGQRQAQGEPREVAIGLRRSVAAVAEAGARLNHALREGCPEMAALLDEIEALPDGSILTVTTQEVFLPWELLYPHPWNRDFTPKQKAAHPVRPEAFWGARLAIETLQQRGAAQVQQLIERQCRQPARVAINLDPGIAAAAAPADEQPVTAHRRWADRLRQHQQLEGWHDDCGAMRQVLQDGDCEATLFYIYCHGAAAQSGMDEKLVLAAGCELDPGLVVEGGPYPSAPLVILNACETGQHSPLAFGNFLAAFRQRGALGLIAATAPVPIVFGAHFGMQLAEQCLQRTGSLAQMLYRLRREHLLERGNPVPMFYSLQCQVTYPQAPADAAGAPSPAARAAPP